MDGYLTTLRRRRGLVQNLVQEREKIRQDTLRAQEHAVTADANTKKILAQQYHGAKALALYRKTKQYERHKIKRFRKIRHQFLAHAATNERKMFEGWVDWLKEEKIRHHHSITKKQRRDKELDIEQAEQQLKNETLAKLVQDAHAPRRSGTNYEKSRGVRRRERLYAAGRAHHETGLLHRVDHQGLGYVEEKGRPRPTQLLIRPIPEILNPPHVDRPEYPTTKHVAEAQKEDPLFSCVLFYLRLPLEIRDGQKLVEDDLTKERQAMSDAELFRKRQDGQGKGVENHLQERRAHRERRQEEYLLQEFHVHNLSLPVTVKKMMRICRPLTLDPVNHCLYLCRRPDIPQALSQVHDRKTYLMGGHRSPDDLLKTKLLVVPPIARASVLWWCYQESQQKIQQQEQWEQSNSQLRAARHKRRQEIVELHALESKMIHEGVDPRELEKLGVVDPVEEQALQKMEDADTQAEIAARAKAEKRVARCARLLDRTKNLKKMQHRDRHGQHKKQQKNTHTNKHKHKHKMSTNEYTTKMTELDPEYQKGELLNNQMEATLEETIENVLETILIRFWWEEVASDVRRYCNQFTLSDAPADALQSRGGAHDSHRQLYLASTRNDLEEMRRLVEHEKAGVFARGTELGETAIHHAIRHRNFPMVQFLHDECYGGVKRQKIESTRQTPAMLATSTGQFDMLKWMIKHNFPLEGVDACGMTIVHHAVLSGKLDMVKFLVLRLQGAFPLIVDGQDENGMTPRWLARGNGLNEIAEWMGTTLARYEGNIQRRRELDVDALFGDEYDPTSDYKMQRSTNLMQRYARRWLAIRYVKKFKQDEKARKQREIDLQFMPPSMRKRNSLSSIDLEGSLSKGKKKKKKKKKRKK
jgi:serine/threonine-protein phosphatase 6 regulatory ankyrin repeat subunit B